MGKWVGGPRKQETYRTGSIDSQSPAGFVDWSGFFLVGRWSRTKEAVDIYSFIVGDESNRLSYGTERRKRRRQETSICCCPQLRRLGPGYCHCHCQCSFLRSLSRQAGPLVVVVRRSRKEYISIHQRFSREKERCAGPASLRTDRTTVNIKS